VPSDAEGDGLMPAGPASSKISPATLDQYFESIEDPFRETQEGQSTESHIGWFVGVFIFCLIPLIPFVLSKLAWRIFGPRIVSVQHLQFHLASFRFWWVLSFAISLLLLALVAKFSGVTAEDKKKWLSPVQMRFAYCYSVVEEVRHYRTNQRPAHIDAALEFLDKAFKSMFQDSSVSPVEQIHLSRYYATIVGPFALDSYPPWYRVHPETETILRAFREFVPKLHDRLKDKKDLGSIEAALTDLAAYQYTQIPELSESKSEPRFEEGTEVLFKFAQQIVALPPYRSERLNPTPKETLARRLLIAGRQVSLPFTHRNVLVAFCAWLVLMLVLFWGGFYIALRFFPLKMDSTIMTALIGGPVATAVTGATIPRLGKSKKRQG
jgi:hypothetical protein